MTAYTVEWAPEASDELAEIWMQASDRRAVADAQDQIDRLLARDQFGNGRHRSEGLYVVIVSPLTCTYTIDDARRFVEVTWVWHSP